MLVQTRQSRALQSRVAALTLVEVLIAITTLALVIAGLVYGYAQANRMAEWSSMSAAGESFALQGMEQARAAQWNPWSAQTNIGPGYADELGSSQALGLPTTTALITNVDLLDVPIKGDPFTSGSGGSTNSSFWGTNYVYVTEVSNSFQVRLRQIRSDAIWIFPMTGQAFTNTVITMRASDE